MTMLSLREAARRLGIKRMSTARRYLHARGAVVTETRTDRGVRYHITQHELERVCPQLSADITIAIRAELTNLHKEIDEIRDRLDRANVA